MTDALTLFGTEEASDPGAVVSYGDASFQLRQGVVSNLTVNGEEIIRQVAFLARDADWGTLAPLLQDMEEKRTDEGVQIEFNLSFTQDDARLDAKVRLVLGEHWLDIEAKARATGRFQTNRAGFTVLHPITGQAGAPVRVVHSDGTAEDTIFPELIAPWQPFQDIAELTHRSGRVTCRCRFVGDVFEMEDQRQWGDASFKTYNRPLALPWPYEIGDGETFRQAIRLRWSESAVPATALDDTAVQEGARFPQTAILLTPDQALRAAHRVDDIASVGPQRLLCHVDASKGDVERQFAAFAELQGVAGGPLCDLELIGHFPEGAAVDPDEELDRHAAAMRESGFRPVSIFICPSVDRQSTPPGSEWPDCPPLDAVFRAARAAFGEIELGGGMASLFTEFNRKRPPVDPLDFVSHALNPIVHDASDEAVMEMLEAIPHITRSARAIAGGKPYRIGPSTIAMRQNPYGSRTFANPNRQRICMTHDDPRHRAMFGAAYTLGVAVSLAPAAIEVWTPAEFYGPRGLFDNDGREWPLTAAVRALSACAGRPVLAGTRVGDLLRLELEGAEFAVNVGPEPADGLSAYEWRGGLQRG